MTDIRELTHQFIEILLRGRRQDAVQFARRQLDAGMLPLDLYVDLLQSSMYEIGALWESGHITVAQEHMATAITEFVMASLYPFIASNAPTRGRAVVTGVEGETHQIGAHMVADAWESDGWDVCFLGSNTPPEAILRVVEQHKPAVIGISATMEFSMPRVQALIEMLRGQLEQPPRIAVGGAVFRRDPSLAPRVGADAYARDLRAAVALLRE